MGGLGHLPACISCTSPFRNPFFSILLPLPQFRHLAFLMVITSHSTGQPLNCLLFILSDRLIFLRCKCKHVFLITFRLENFQRHIQSFLCDLAYASFFSPTDVDVPCHRVGHSYTQLVSNCPIIPLSVCLKFLLLYPKHLAQNLANKHSYKVCKFNKSKMSNSKKKVLHYFHYHQSHLSNFCLT